MDVDIVDYKVDIHTNDSTRTPRELVSFGNGDEIANVTKSVVGYSLFDSDEIADLEEKCLSMIKRASKGKLKADSVSLHKRERRVTYQFGKGYRLGRKEQEIAKLKDSLDISPIPDWIKESIIEKLVKTRLVPSGWIDSIEISDFSKYGFKVPSVDPISLFLRPSFQLTLFGDSALCFGAKYYYNDEPVFSDPRFRLPSYRGILYKFQGYASDKMNNCVRACDTKERILTITLRRTCDDAPISRPISDGESLRNFDEKKIQKELDKVLEQKTLPYIRNFELVKKSESSEKKEKSKKRSKKEELSFLKNSSKKRREDDRPKIVKTKEDERWKFGNSPDRVKTEWSSDEEVDRRTGQKRTKRKETKKTNDVTDILMEYSSRRSTSREKDNKGIEREVHMKKTRKERGREFRSKINEKFGFRPTVVQSDEEEDSEEENEKRNDKKQKRIKAFYL